MPVNLNQTITEKEAKTEAAALSADPPWIRVTETTAPLIGSFVGETTPSMPRHVAAAGVRGETQIVVCSPLRYHHLSLASTSAKG